MDVVVANDIPQSGDGAHRAQNWNMVVASQWNFLLPFTTLYGLGEAEVEHDPLDALVIQVLNVTPADQPKGVDLLVCSWDEA